MEKLWRQDQRAYALAIVLLATVLLVAGCGTVPARSQSAAQLPAASGSSAPSGSQAASGQPGRVRVVSGIRAADSVRAAVHGPDVAGFAADDLGQYRVGPALDAESRRNQ